MPKKYDPEVKAAGRTAPLRWDAGASSAGSAKVEGDLLMRRVVVAAVVLVWCAVPASYLADLSGTGTAETPGYSRGSPHVDHPVFNGGSIGDLGERVLVNSTPGPLDELTPNDVVAPQGDGVMVLAGPDFMGLTGTQHLVVRVINRAFLSTTYDIEIVSPDGVVIATARTTVPGRTEQLVTVAVDPSTLTLGHHQLDFLLYSHTLRLEQVSQLPNTVAVLDPQDTELVAALRGVLEEFEAAPDRGGFAQEVLDVVRALLVGEEQVVTPGPGTEVPMPRPKTVPRTRLGEDATETASTTTLASGPSTTGAAITATVLLAALAVTTGTVLTVRTRRARTATDPRAPDPDTT